MEKYILQKDDFELVERMKEAASSVEMAYKGLYTLEVNGQKDSKEYNSIFKQLKRAISAEGKIYESSDLSFSKCHTLINFVVGFKAPSDFSMDNEGVILQDFDNMALRRVLNNLIYKMFHDENNVKELIPDEVMKALEFLGIEDSEQQITSSAINSSELQKSIERDINNSFLFFIQECIDNKDFETIKDRLIQSKYYTSFINKTSEEDMLERRFNAGKDFYLYSRFVADVTKIGIEPYAIVRNHKSTEVLTSQISEMLDNNDEDLDEDENYISFVLRQCMARAALLNMDEESIADVNSTFHDYIESIQYRFFHAEDHLGSDAVISCFKSVNRDRSKPSVLSLGLKNN